MQNENKRNKTTSEQYYIYGKHATIAAIKNPSRYIAKIYCTANFFDSAKDILTQQNILPKVQIVDNRFIDQKLRSNVPHQGIIIQTRTIFLDDINKFDFTSNQERIAVLDQITDPQNIGTIIRSAAAFGFNKIILPKNSAPDESGSIAKAACGCLELVQIAKVTNLKQSLDTLKKKGFWVVGMDIKGQTDFNLIKTIEKLVVVIGSEGKGMRNLTSRSCDYHIRIPIAHNVESLNAASAASIVFHQLAVTKI